MYRQLKNYLMATLAYKKIYERIGKGRKKEGRKEEGDGGFRRERRGKGGRMKETWFNR